MWYGSDTNIVLRLIKLQHLSVNVHKVGLVILDILTGKIEIVFPSRVIKDGAYYCYCVYVLRISR